MNVIILLIIIIAAIALINYFLTAPSGDRGQPRSFMSRLRRGFNTRQEDWRSGSLRRELYKRVDPPTAERLIQQAKFKTPGKPEHWYLEKVLYDLRRGR